MTIRGVGRHSYQNSFVQIYVTVDNLQKCGKQTLRKQGQYLGDEIIVYVCILCVVLSFEM